MNKGEFITEKANNITDSKLTTHFRRKYKKIKKKNNYFYILFH